MKTNHMCGFAIVEVLVVLVIMTIGLLGMAGLQVSSVKQSTSSSYQTVAMMLADDLIGRMTANLTAIRAGKANYTKANGANFPSAVAACNASPGCSAANMAASDLAQWAQMLNNSLPVTAANLSSTFVCIDSNPSDAVICDGIGSAYVIQIAWSEQIEGGNTTNTQTYQAVYQP